ncbi:MAG: hypothetical protein AB7L09_02470 [Nitrospira sp.]
MRHRCYEPSDIVSVYVSVGVTLVGRVVAVHDDGPNARPAGGIRYDVAVHDSVHGSVKIVSVAAWRVCDPPILEALADINE